MDLRSGAPYFLWKNGRLGEYAPLEKDADCDVAILGAGITGAFLGNRLAREGVEAIVLDRRRVGTGSTAASTGLLQYETDLDLGELITRVGERDAVRIYRSGLEAIAEIESLLGDLGDDCGFARRKTLYLASRKGHAKRLFEECRTRRRLGFEVSFLDEDAVEKVVPFRASAAILSEGDGEVDPFRLTHRLLEDGIRRGLRVHENTEAAVVKAAGGRALLVTSDGIRVTARRVMYATGYESEEHLKRRWGRLRSTFAIVSEPIGDMAAWTDRCLIWESSRPYVYLRTTPDGRAMIGGEDVSFGASHRDASLLERKTERLERRFRALFPEMDFRTAGSWAGTFGETKDGLARIGEPPGMEDSYFVLGYGGNGITFGCIAARILTDLHLVRPSPDARVFSFAR